MRKFTVLNDAHLLTAQACFTSPLTLRSHCLHIFPLESLYIVVILYFRKSKKLSEKNHETRRKRGPGWGLTSGQSVSVSQHAGTGSTGSGSLLLGHYVTRWAQLALLLACEAEREPSVSGQREVKEACVHSSRTPRHASLYKPKSIQTAAVSRHF